MNAEQFKTIIITSLVASAGMANAVTLITSNFDGNDSQSTGYIKDGSGSSTATVSWTTDAAVTSPSTLSAISQGTSTGFVNLGGEYANGNNIMLNYNLNNSAGPEGYSFTFDLTGNWALDKINVLARHTNDIAVAAQAGNSDLTIAISGGTLGAAVSQTTNESNIFNASGGEPYNSVDFEPVATTLGAGTYTVQVTANNLSDVGGAYATFDGITIEATAVPEPATSALLGLGGLALILRRRN